MMTKRPRRLDSIATHRFEWHGANGIVDGIEFRLGYGDRIRLLISCGFEIAGSSSFDVTCSEQTGSFHRARKSDAGGIR